jgi:hypothetical protein
VLVSAASVAGAAALGLVAPVGLGVLSAPLAVAGGSGWEWAEGLIVGAVVLLAELVGVRQLGKRAREKDRADRLAARNARIAAHRVGDPLEVSNL